MLLLLSTAISPGFSQTTISWETYPSAYNAGLTRSLNGLFQGSIGMWSAYSESNSTVSINSSNSALQLINYPSSSVSSTSTASSPVISCASTCIGSAKISFLLHTAQISQANTNLSFYVEVSGDGGTSWTKIYSKTGQDLFNLFGSNTYNNLSVPIPVSFLTANFRYRLRATQAAGCAFNSILIIDDVKIITTPCTNTSNLNLGNLVWDDLNMDNVRDTNEPGIAGVTVKLYKDDNNDNVADAAAIKTTTTNSSGNYTFTNLAAGNYIVGVVIPVGNVRGPQTEIDPDDNVDNDNNAVYLLGDNKPGSEVRSKSITLAAGSEPTNDGDDANGNLTLDMALCQATPTNDNLSIGNLIWRDNNGNGTRDAGEPGIANIPVYLYTDKNNDNIADSAAIKETTTDANGNYRFKGLSAGNYLIGITIPTGLVRGYINTGANDPDNNIDNDNNGTVLLGANTAGSKVRTYAITLTAGIEPTTDGDDANTNSTLDIGLCPAPTNILTLGNLIWRDNNANGIRDAGEPGLAGVTVWLYNDNNNDNVADSIAIRSTVTDSAGMYKFTNLNPGNYIIGVTIPQGLVRGYASAGANDPDNNIDNDNNGTLLLGPNEAGSKIRTYAITLTAGSEPTADGDDANGNLTLDIGLCPAPPPPPSGPCPNGLLGTGSNYYGGFEAGSNNFSSTTGSDLYEGLPRNGSYQVVQNISQLGGGGYLNIQPRNGDFFLASHTSNNSSDRIWYTTLTVTPGQTYNFCANATLLKNLGSGARYLLSLYVNGTPIDTARITFDWVSLCGSYTVPASVTTLEFSIRDPKKGLFFVAIDDICITGTTPPPSSNNLSLGNLVWNDKNLNNVRDTSEPGIQGVTVKLYKDANNDNVADGTAIQTTTTNAGGNYSFSNLSAGNYIVGITIPVGNVRGAQTTVDPDNNIDNDNNGVYLIGNNAAGGEIRSKAITLSAGIEPTNDGDGSNGNLTLDIALCEATTPTPPLSGPCVGTTSAAGYFGGFEAGNNNFSNNSAATDLYEGLPRNGSYEIVSSVGSAGGGGYLNIAPQTGNKFMLIHTSSNANDRLWSVKANVTPGDTVTFCASIANAKADPVNGFTVTLIANNKTIGSRTAVYGWNDVCGTYVVPAGVTTVEFSIKDPNPSFGPSHFLALDDICVSINSAGGTPRSVNEAARPAVTQNERGAVPSVTSAVLYPNPAVDHFAVRFNSDKETTATIRITDVLGKTVLTQSKTVNNGVNTIAFSNTKYLQVGTYNVQIISGDQIINQKLIISKRN